MGRDTSPVGALHQPLLHVSGDDESCVRGGGAVVLREAVLLLAAVVAGGGGEHVGDAGAQLRRLPLAGGEQRVRRAGLRAARGLPPEGVRNGAGVVRGGRRRGDRAAGRGAGGGRNRVVSPADLNLKGGVMNNFSHNLYDS